jgi:1-deoxy-D-xylulose-5-phosphate reductoisomerase
MLRSGARVKPSFPLTVERRVAYTRTDPRVWPGPGWPIRRTPLTEADGGATYGAVMTKRIAILGSTGSIGKRALRVIEALGPDYQVVALSGHSQIDLLAEQVRRYRPKVVTVTGEGLEARLRTLVEGLDVEVWTGPGGLVRMVQREDVDGVLSAVVGAAGLPAVLAAAACGRRLAIANKEPLVVAGQLLTETAKAHGSTILPVDSEHSAVFQALHAGRPEEIQRIILTGSGGPFRKAHSTDLRTVTREQALAHPIWAMGPKITIDSATLMNKALEIIEARWLFDVPADKIEVLIHPESIVHSLVEFVDGSMIAQMGHPDMGLPIQYALTYPQRIKGSFQRVRLEQLGRLTFESPNPETSRALALAYQVVRTGGTTPAVFNAANEAAVAAFLEGQITFLQILELVERCLDRHAARTCATLEDLLEADAWARQEVQREISGQKGKVALTVEKSKVRAQG